MSLYRPVSLQAGDRIRIVAPAGRVEKNKIIPAIELLQQEGFEVITGSHVFNNHYRFAGTDEQRLHDLQQAFNDSRCKAVICARGGYGTIRIIDKLDITPFRRHPKWVVGFSDITALHALLQKEGFCSIHGPMPGLFVDNGNPTGSYRQLIELLKGYGGAPELPLQWRPLNRAGTMKGVLTGGNLSLLYSFMGTPLEPQTTGTILFIEDIGENLYHLDRMMRSLKMGGKLAQLKGLVAGNFSEMKDDEPPFGQTAEEIIYDAVRDYDYPVCFGFPAGHDRHNTPLVMGGEYVFTVTPDNVSARMT